MGVVATLQQPAVRKQRVLQTRTHVLPFSPFSIKKKPPILQALVSSACYLCYASFSHATEKKNSNSPSSLIIVSISDHDGGEKPTPLSGLPAVITTLVSLPVDASATGAQADYKRIAKTTAPTSPSLDSTHPPSAKHDSSPAPNIQHPTHSNMSHSDVSRSPDKKN